MNRRQKDRVFVLERRAKWLAQRLLDYDKKGDPSFTRAELRALTWAIHIIRATEQEGVLELMESIPIHASIEVPETTTNGGGNS